MSFYSTGILRFNLFNFFMKIFHFSENNLVNSIWFKVFLEEVSQTGLLLYFFCHRDALCGDFRTVKTCCIFSKRFM